MKECKAAPRSIWLNFGEITEDEAKDTDIRNFDGITWYDGDDDYQIDDYDVRYIRKSFIIDIIDGMIKEYNGLKSDYESLQRYYDVDDIEQRLYSLTELKDKL